MSTTVFRSLLNVGRGRILSHISTPSLFHSHLPSIHRYSNIPDFEGIGRVNHIAIVCSDLQSSSNMYRNVLKADVSEPHELPEHGVITVFVDLGNTKIELLSPLGEQSPIASFLAKNPSGGMHHICIEVNDIQAAAQQLTKNEKRILGEIKLGAHGLPVLFVHPKDMGGVLIELEEVAKK